MNLTRKLITSHLLEGRPQPGEEIVLRVDQTLTEDATALSTYQHLERMGAALAPDLVAVSFIDHNPHEVSAETADDHRYLHTIAAHYGLFESPAGNGICHQVFLERFARPRALLIGADSHTPTAGAVGALAIGSGGLEVAAAMVSGRFHTRMPAIVGIELRGQLRPWVTAKDIILELLRRFGVRWGVGKVAEFCGPAAAALSVPQRATITSMGAELELTSSIFPADESVRRWLTAQGREADFSPLAADEPMDFDDVAVVNLDELEPLIALPSSPDNVRPVQEVAGAPLEQVLIGTCTNSSYEDLALVAAILRGRRVPASVTLAVTPGTRQVQHALALSGELADLIAAGARILEPCCGPCIGMDMRPSPGAASLRTYNRNFPSRSGTAGDQVYLCSPAVAAASALKGQISDPRELGTPPPITPPARYPPTPGLIPPPAGRGATPIFHGPRYTPPPPVEPLPNELRGRVLIVVGDEITTDHIMPAKPSIAAGPDTQALGGLVFSRLDPDFAARARSWSGGFIVAGHNYGQGSSREQAVLGPLVLDIRVIVACSYARIHHTNLVNFGILPLVFGDPADYGTIQIGDEWELINLRTALHSGRPVTVSDHTHNRRLTLTYTLTPRQVDILLAGGLLNHIGMGGRGP